MRLRQTTALFSASLLLAAICAVGCGDDDRPTDQGEWPPPLPEPRWVIDSLKAAVSARDGAAFVHWFDRDAYFFEFSADERDGRPELPLGLSLAEDSLAIEHTIGAPGLSAIKLSAEVSGQTAATDQDRLPGGPNGIWKVTLRELSLGVRSNSADRDSLLATGDGAELFFRRVELRGASGPPYRIVRWRDLPRQTSAADTVSFGLLKWRALHSSAVR